MRNSSALGVSLVGAAVGRTYGMPHTRHSTLPRYVAAAYFISESGCLKTGLWPGCSVRLYASRAKG